MTLNHWIWSLLYVYIYTYLSLSLYLFLSFSLSFSFSVPLSISLSSLSLSLCLSYVSLSLFFLWVPFYLSLSLSALNPGGGGARKNTIKQGVLDSPTPWLRGWTSTSLIKGVWVVRVFTTPWNLVWEEKCLWNHGKYCPHNLRRDSKSQRDSTFTTRSKFTMHSIFATAGSFGRNGRTRILLLFPPSGKVHTKGSYSAKGRASAF